jgi:hypothetical protein
LARNWCPKVEVENILLATELDLADGWMGVKPTLRDCSSKSNNA